MENYTEELKKIIKKEHKDKFESYSNEKEIEELTKFLYLKYYKNLSEYKINSNCDNKIIYSSIKNKIIRYILNDKQKHTTYYIENENKIIKNRKILFNYNNNIILKEINLKKYNYNFKEEKSFLKNFVMNLKNIESNSKVEFNIIIKDIYYIYDINKKFKDCNVEFEFIYKIFN